MISKVLHSTQMINEHCSLIIRRPLIPACLFIYPAQANRYDYWEFHYHTEGTEAISQFLGNSIDSFEDLRAKSFQMKKLWMYSDWFFPVFPCFIDNFFNTEYLFYWNTLPSKSWQQAKWIIWHHHCSFAWIGDVVRLWPKACTHKSYSVNIGGIIPLEKLFIAYWNCTTTISVV